MSLSIGNSVLDRSKEGRFLPDVLRIDCWRLKLLLEENGLKGEAGKSGDASEIVADVLGRSTFVWAFK